MAEQVAGCPWVNFIFIKVLCQPPPLISFPSKVSGVINSLDLAIMGAQNESNAGFESKAGWGPIGTLPSCHKHSGLALKDLEEMVLC